jgi:hypothetical protein
MPAGVGAVIEQHAWPVHVVRFDSQPSSAPLGGNEQLPKFGLHVESQTPPVQRGVATLVLLQARPQAPQLPVSTSVCVSQPLVSGAVALQSE